jgi:hypothetical protein
VRPVLLFRSFAPKGVRSVVGRFSRLPVVVPVGWPGQGVVRGPGISVSVSRLRSVVLWLRCLPPYAVCSLGPKC